MNPSERIGKMISEQETSFKWVYSTVYWELYYLFLNSSEENQTENEKSLKQRMKMKFRRRSLSPMMRVQSMIEDDSDTNSDKKSRDDEESKK